jgi:hypothetical protein
MRGLVGLTQNESQAGAYGEWEASQTDARRVNICKEVDQAFCSFSSQVSIDLYDAQ